MAPDHGAQGNALKTLIAMPFVLDGERVCVYRCGEVGLDGPHLDQSDLPAPVHAPFLERLVAGYIADDQDNGRERTVRELVAEFRGFTAEAPSRRVCWTPQTSTACLCPRGLPVVASTVASYAISSSQ